MIDDNILRIRYDIPMGSQNGIVIYEKDGGAVTIDMSVFFPCAVPCLKKLLRIAKLDYEHYEAHIEQMRGYFETRIEELETERKVNGRTYFDKKQLEADAKERVVTRKHPNGVPLTADEVKHWKEVQRDSKREAKEALSDAKWNKRDKEWFAKNIKCLQ